MFEQVRLWYRGEYRHQTMKQHATWAFRKTPESEEQWQIALRTCQNPPEVPWPSSFGGFCMLLSHAGNQLRAAHGALDRAVPPGKEDEALARGEWFVGCGRAALAPELHK